MNIAVPLCETRRQCISKAAYYRRIAFPELIVHGAFFRITHTVYVTEICGLSVECPSRIACGIIHFLKAIGKALHAEFTFGYPFSEIYSFKSVALLKYSFPEFLYTAGNVYFLQFRAVLERVCFKLFQAFGQHGIIERKAVSERLAVYVRDPFGNNYLLQ